MPSPIFIATYEDIRDTKKLENYKRAKKDADSKERGRDAIELMYARCQIEQAFALYHDLNIARWDGREWRSRQVQASETALTLGKNFD